MQSCSRPGAAFSDRVLVLLYAFEKFGFRADMETVWEDLVKYTPSGTYYVRVRVAGKLHLKSLDTPVLTVARQRLTDEIHKLRAQAASVMAVRVGVMITAPSSSSRSNESFTFPSEACFTASR